MHVTPHTAGTLADFTSLALIIPALQGRTNRAVVQELADALHRVEGATGHLFASLTALNYKLLTGISLDGGAACPQVKLAGVDHPRFALGRSTEPLHWRASFYPPIEFVFLVIKPVKDGDDSKQLFIALTALKGNAAQLNQLRAATAAEDLLAVLTQCPLSIGGQSVKA
jgi:mannitol/fructose-specific phosphotransferase system IIA component (Ntr-type)